MLEIAGHVTVLTIHLIERSNIQTKKMTRHTTWGHLATCQKNLKWISNLKLLPILPLLQLGFRLVHVSALVAVLCPLQKMEHMVMTLTPRVQRVRE